MNIIMIIITILQINSPIITEIEYQFKSTSIYNEKNTVYTEKPIYTEEETNNNRPGPRKVSGIDGWITWLTWGQFNGVPSNASNSDMYDYYNYIQNGGNMNYTDWYDNKYNPVPIEDIYILIIMSLVYFYYILYTHRNRIAERCDSTSQGRPKLKKQ